MDGTDLRIARPSHLTRRLCRSCGYSGEDLQQPDAGPVFCCPSCGADLYARPPRSYAEMELLVPVSASKPAPAVRKRRSWASRFCVGLLRLIRR